MVLRLVQTLFTKTASTAVRKTLPTNNFFSRGMHTKVNSSAAEMAREREAYEDAYQLASNRRDAFVAKMHAEGQFVAPWTEDSLVTRESHAAWRQIERNWLDRQLDELYPFPPKPPGLR